MNIQPTAKVAALQSCAIDATTHMYSVYFIYEDVFGDDLGFALLRDHGLNPYGLTYFVNGAPAEAKTELKRAMVQVTQKAFQFCLATPEPCAQALSSAVSMKASDAALELEYASKVIPGLGNTLPIGVFDPARVAIDYEMVAGAFNIAAYDPTRLHQRVHRHHDRLPKLRTFKSGSGRFGGRGYGHRADIAVKLRSEVRGRTTAFGSSQLDN